MAASLLSSRIGNSRRRGRGRERLRLTFAPRKMRAVVAFPSLALMIGESTPETTAAEADPAPPAARDRAATETGADLAVDPAGLHPVVVIEDAVEAGRRFPCAEKGEKITCSFGLEGGVVLLCFDCFVGGVGAGYLGMGLFVDGWRLRGVSANVMGREGLHVSLWKREASWLGHVKPQDLDTHTLLPFCLGASQGRGPTACTYIRLRHVRIHPWR